MDASNITLTTVNEVLLKKLHNLINDASSAEEILSLTEAVAKLNTSSRNNNQLQAPMSEEEKIEQAQREQFGVLAEGVVV